MKRLIPAAVLAALVLATLTACNPGGGAVDDYPGFPEDISTSGEIDEDLGEGPQAFWLGDGDQIAVVIGGSSTCPNVGTDISVLKPADEGNEVEISVRPLPDQPCTADFVPHTTVFWTPVFVTTTKPLIVHVLGDTIEVPIK